MIIKPTLCAQSYAYNDRVERAIANYLAEITGLQVCDFSVGKRSEYDFQIGDDRGWVQMELKTTTSNYVPVEVSSDAARQVPTGLSLTTAPLVVVLSKGMRGGYAGDVGKLRVWRRNTLIREAMQAGMGKYHDGTPGAYIYSFKPGSESSHIYLGDMPVTYEVMGFADDKPVHVIGYDLAAIFDDNKLYAEQLLEEINIRRGVE